ncbi:MAG: glycosyltransferase, partial [Euryarchaeota archaeon]
LILESFLNISQPIPNLVVAGPIDDAGYKLHLDGLIEKIVVKHPDWQCIWTGMLTGDKKWGALRSADAFILPSHQENFGIAVIESLAVGTPVLISNKVNIYTEIIDSDAGLVSDDTVNGVTKLLNDWIQSGDRTKDKCSDNAKKCFYNNFEITSAAKNLETLLSEAIASNSN